MLATGSSWRRSDTVRAGVAAVVLVLSTVASWRSVSVLETRVFAWVNGLPSWLEAPTWPVMQLGTVGLAALVGLIVGWAMGRPRLAFELAITPTVAWFVARAIKDVVERGRPAAEGLTVTLRGSIDAGYGFVSGHSAVAFALATVVAPHLRGWWRAVPWSLAVVVALARLHVGAHLPLDVIGGAATGILVGEATRRIEHWLRARDRAVKDR